MSIEIVGTYPAYVNVAVPVAVDKLFSYHVPPEFQPAIRRGMRVTVPFGRRTLPGIVIETMMQSTIPNLRSITDVLDAEPILSDELLDLSLWMSEYYFSPLGEVLRSVLVPGALKIGKRSVSFTGTNGNLILSELFAAPRQASVIRELMNESPQTIQQLQKKLGMKNLSPILNELAKKGYIAIDEEKQFPLPKPKFEQYVLLEEEDRKQLDSWLSVHGTEKNEKRLAKQLAVIRFLIAWSRESPAPSVPHLLKSAKVSSAIVLTLKKKGVLRTGKRESPRTSEYEPYSAALGATDVVLNQAQVTAISAIADQLTKNEFHVFLLHGVTGSGKTQVYIELMKQAIADGGTSILLVPEIALTPQIVRRFKYYFGEKVIALHSRMSAGERFDAWRMAREGKRSIIIGPRSVIFAPLKNLKLIIVDEEHEPSFKQFDKTPRYHGRDVAIIRARKNNAVVALGSATPSFESYHNAQSGKYTLLTMPERVDNARLPPIEIVDMLAERKKKYQLFKEQRKADYEADPVKAKEERKKFEGFSISDVLQSHIEQRLVKKEGVILLQNRRGFAPFIECGECGYIAMCKHCNISLTYHATKKHLRCHYCGTVERPPDVCPQCQSIDIAYKGFGTQRVEEELKALFPKAKIIRMDMDTTTRRGSHDAMLKKFGEGEADILLGTQMVAKGLDFSRVTLVGVISADIQMLLPDFRATERTFQLLTQVAGRSGRGDLAGEVIIQTSHPGHECLKHVIKHDFVSFYEEEIQERQESRLTYPPFSRLMLIEFKGKHEELVGNVADAFRAILKKYGHSFIVLGPSPAAIPKIKSLYRSQLIIKALKSEDPGGHIAHRAVERTLHEYRSTAQGKGKSVIITVDVDPVGMM